MPYYPTTTLHSIQLASANYPTIQHFCETEKKLHKHKNERDVKVWFLPKKYSYGFYTRNSIGNNVSEIWSNKLNMHKIYGKTITWLRTVESKRWQLLHLLYISILECVWTSWWANVFNIKQEAVKWLSTFTKLKGTRGITYWLLSAQLTSLTTQGTLHCCNILQTPSQLL